MTTNGRLLVCGISFLMLCVEGSVLTNFTTSQIISSHDYPQPYPRGVSETWVWHKDTGLWGIKFIDVDLTEPDTLIIKDGEKEPIYIYKLHSRLDTTGPKLQITFQSGNSTQSRGRGFKLDVRYGVNKRALDKAFLESNPPPPTQSPPDLGTILPLLLAIATIALLLFLAVVSWFICHRRRRRQQQQVSLSVNVEGGIRRDSGVRYTRKPSTQSQLEEPQSPRKTSNLVRSNSNRSWMVRAELSATTSPAASTPNGRCNGNGTAHTVQNVYTPMETDTMQLQSKVSLDLQGQGRSERQVFRSRIPTLDKVPEDQLMTRVPAASLEVSQDDGYLGPSPKSPASSYLNCPISDSGEVTKFQPEPSAGRCEASYQNITVTGRVGIV